MKRIKVEQAVGMYLELQPGDEIHINRKLPQALESMLAATRLDGSKVLRLMDGRETAVIARGESRQAVA